MNKILQGTTPTLTITIPEEIPVASIIALELVFKNNANANILSLSDVATDSTANTISYTFTEEETLALSQAFPLLWQLRVKTADGIFGTEAARIEVVDLINTEAIE